MDRRRWILLAGRVRPRLVAVGGLLTAVGFALRRLAALSAQPGRQQRAAVRAPEGGVHTLQLADDQRVVIVVATVIGAVLAEDPGRLGRFIRTRGAEVPGRPRSAPDGPSQLSHQRALIPIGGPCTRKASPWRGKGVLVLRPAAIGPFVPVGQADHPGAHDNRDGRVEPSQRGVCHLKLGHSSINPNRRWRWGLGPPTRHCGEIPRSQPRSIHVSRRSPDLPPRPRGRAARPVVVATAGPQ